MITRIDNTSEVTKEFGRRKRRVTSIESSSKSYDYVEQRKEYQSQYGRRKKRVLRVVKNDSVDITA